MNNQHSNNSFGVYNFIPPHILESIARNGNLRQRQVAERTLELDRQIRQQRVMQMEVNKGKRKEAQGPSKNRMVYNANNLTELPGILVRSEGQAATNDLEVDEAYAGFGATFDLY